MTKLSTFLVLFGLAVSGIPATAGAETASVEIQPGSSVRISPSSPTLVTCASDGALSGSRVTMIEKTCECKLVNNTYQAAHYILQLSALTSNGEIKTTNLGTFDDIIRCNSKREAHQFCK